MAAAHTVNIEGVLYAARQFVNLACLDLGRRWTMITWGTTQPIQIGNDWKESIRTACKNFGTEPKHGLPFESGCVGWFGYEAGREMERMLPPKAPRVLPDVCFWRTTGAMWYDRHTRKWLVVGSKPFVSQANEVLKEAVTLPPPPDREPPTQTTHDSVPDRYKEGIHKILEEIAAGNVYQANLAWKTPDFALSDPLRSWIRLRRHNPSNRGAYLKERDSHILSNSPELYLDVSPRMTETVITSAPIKGTVNYTPRNDEARWHLWQSDKERAELTMIADLVRNDLGRVAKVGSVRASPRRLRRCGDLLHAERIITAQLRSELDAMDVIEATFPPGSVTGAPKVAAMALINRLEPHVRGVYTGGIGFVSDTGAVQFNVAIRTTTVRNGLAHFHVGAGIVADSVPENEMKETLAKGRAMQTWLRS